MKANNLTISIPSKKPCRRCPYCISRMTMQIPEDEVAFLKNLGTALAVAERVGVTHTLITSKNEPVDNPKIVNKVLNEFLQYNFINELQTKVISLQDITAINRLDLSQLKVLAVSIDDLSKIKLIKDVFPFVRLTINLTNKVDKQLKEQLTLERFISNLPSNVHQVTFRNLTIPDNPLKTEESMRVQEYIFANQNTGYPRLMEELSKYKTIRKLNFGAVIKDVVGIGVVGMEYCIQEEHEEEEIRSLIYHENGGLYTMWNSTASRIF